MPGKIVRTGVLYAAVTLGFLQSGQASAGTSSVGTTPVFIPPIVVTPSGAQTGLNPQTTAAVVSSLNQATAFCSGLKSGEYVVDCLAERLETISRQYAGIQGYDKALQAIVDAAEQLNQIARDNRSSTQRRARFKSQTLGGPSTSRPLTPVESAKMNTAIADALVVIEETETLLLRSADTSVEQAAQFQQIAEAIGSNKVLLRSV
ncbi:MAG: hypothetical protein ACI92Z_003571 [Paracoccaceae bacterium]|jgi:hypothetical protein